MSKKRPYRFIISGGGTGGHVFPAISIADAIRAMDPEAEILFVGAEGRMEMERVPEAGYPIEGLHIRGLDRKNMLKNLSLPVILGSSLLKARKIIRNFKPDMAIGVGGYASGPTLYVAAKMGIPVIIQEQNSYPGITNKLLGKYAQRIYVAYDGMERWFDPAKIVKSGNPVRKSILQSDVSKEEALESFGWDRSKPVVLVVGGSLGSRTINESIASSLEAFQHAGLRLIWQTGKIYFDQYKNKAAESPDVKIVPFIRDMAGAYAAADVIVSRAGAIAVSELQIVGKPVILVPSPNVAEDHQSKNAKALEDRNAALTVRDMEAPQKLGEQIIKLMENGGLREKMGQNIKKMAIADAAERIAREVLEELGKKEDKGAAD